MVELIVMVEHHGCADNQVDEIYQIGAVYQYDTKITFNDKDCPLEGIPKEP